MSKVGRVHRKIQKAESIQGVKTDARTHRRERTSISNKRQSRVCLAVKKACLYVRALLLVVNSTFCTFSVMRFPRRLLNTLESKIL